MTAALLHIKELMFTLNFCIALNNQLRTGADKGNPTV